MKPMLISKSRFLDGVKCGKLFWNRVHSPDLFEEPSKTESVRFDEGKAVGDLAKKLFPAGVDLESLAGDLTASLDATTNALREREPIFEATFSADGLLVKTDMLVPNDSGDWDLVEVKSSTEVNEEHLLDAAFQLHVLNKVGIRVSRVQICHVNKHYVRQGTIKPEQLFIREDVTQQVVALQDRVATETSALKTFLGATLEPTIEIGPHCHAPHACPMIDRCWDQIPEQSVFNLYRIGSKAWNLHERGIIRLEDIPSDEKLTERQAVQVGTCQTGKPHIDRQALERFLSTVKYPAYFLDFETYSMAIPLIDHCRPYQQIPFQFSLHVLDSPNSEPTHHSFLAGGRDDPRPEFMEELERLLGREGSIVVYNRSFEVSRLRECAELLPVYKDWVKSVESRIVDLLDPFRRFDLYHPDQNGSCSIKAVLPTWTDLSYAELEVQDGGTAASEYLRVTFGDVPVEEEMAVRTNLESYCELDTLAMVELLQKLRLVTALQGG